jgi:hypothetical protein
LNLRPWLLFLISGLLNFVPRTLNFELVPGLPEAKFKLAVPGSRPNA